MGSLYNLSSICLNMTTKQFYKLKWGDLIYHEGIKRMCVVLDWNKIHTKLRVRPSFLTPKVLYLTSGKNIKSAQL